MVCPTENRPCQARVVTKHLKNIYSDEELDEKQTCANFAHADI